MSSLAIIGSTGSIGTQALEVAYLHNIKISALAAYSNDYLLEKQCRQFKPRYACLVDPNAAARLKIALADTNCQVLNGADGLCALAEEAPAELLLNAAVGIAGLPPTINAIRSGKNIALANKEALVAGGRLVMSLAKQYNVDILPVDSEHSAIFQCLQGRNDRQFLKKIILTASGGPFLGKNKSELSNVTAEQALAHPNWSMGPKVTIDSATMMNKGLEAIEARWLFDLRPDQIDIVVHPQSILHSGVEFNDGALIAQLGSTDMRLPIQYALLYPNRIASPAKPIQLTQIANLTFLKPDIENFPALKTALLALNMHDSYTCMINAANEIAVECFLNGSIRFNDIGNFLMKVLELPPTDILSLEDIVNVDRFARQYAKENLPITDS